MSVDHVLVKVVHFPQEKVLLTYDAAAHRELLSRQPHPYAASASEIKETVSTDPRVQGYTNLLDFIVGAQQACYALFGEDEAHWSVDDGAAEDVPSDTRDSSIRVNSSEWSEEDETRRADAESRKRKRTSIR